ncbi:MAG: hypothetical protein N2047_08555 [Meiothermus sp.]|nr:hypothetical protein [Meiothermus sp.]
MTFRRVGAIVASLLLLYALAQAIDGSRALINNSVTLSKIQAVASGVLLGRSSAGTGNVETIQVGTGLALSGGTLSAPGAVPGGTNTQVQFNNNGAFAGASQATVNAAGQIVVGTSGLQLSARSDAAPASTNGQLTLYARTRANRVLPQVKDPDGLDADLQTALYGKRAMIWYPGSGTAMGAIGLTPVTAATLSHPTPTTTTLAESIYRVRFQTSTTAGNTSGVRDNVNTFWRGNGAGRGGFFHFVRFTSGSISLAGGQRCICLSSQTGALAGEPSAMPDVIGIIKDAADSNWFFARRSGTGTTQKVSLGVSVVNNQVFDMVLYARPNGSDLGVLITQLNFDGSSTILLNTTYNDNLPANTTLLSRHLEVRNGTTAAADNLELVQWYSESDF